MTGPVGRPPLSARLDNSRANRSQSPVNPEDTARLEERKRRNRESAAKCRQKLKERLVSCQREVLKLQRIRSALQNERLLLDMEFEKVRAELALHEDHCGFTVSADTPLDALPALMESALEMNGGAGCDDRSGGTTRRTHTPSHTMTRAEAEAQALTEAELECESGAEGEAEGEAEAGAVAQVDSGAHFEADWPVLDEPMEALDDSLSFADVIKTGIDIDGHEGSDLFGTNGNGICKDFGYGID
jgi:hypothetical protein